MPSTGASRPHSTGEAALLAAARAGAVLVFDTETAGFDGSVVQCAVISSWTSGASGAAPREDPEPLAHYCRLWGLAASERMAPRSEAVHGISRNTLDRFGKPPLRELEFLRALVDAGHEGGARWVAHNAQFDITRLNATAASHGMPALLRLGEVFCTMAAATAHCNLATRAGRRKPPRASELYEVLFARPFDGTLHDALEDARMTLACYEAGARRGWWPG